jgi:hypothetical protein
MIALALEGKRPMGQLSRCFSWVLEEKAGKKWKTRNHAKREETGDHPSSSVKWKKRYKNVSTVQSHFMRI